MTPAEQKEQREQDPACGICCGIAMAVMAIISDKQGSSEALTKVKDGMKVVKIELGKA
jgi:hypothetical protein